MSATATEPAGVEGGRRSRSALKAGLIVVTAVLIVVAVFLGWRLVDSCRWRQQTVSASADDNGRVIIQDQTTPQGLQVRVGVGDIPYNSQRGRSTSYGLMIEVSSDSGSGSRPHPLVADPDEDFAMLTSFFTGLHYQVFRTPPGTTLDVRYADGQGMGVEVGEQGYAVVVVEEYGDLEEVVAAAPEGDRCRFLKAPAPDFRDCTPI